MYFYISDSFIDRTIELQESSQSIQNLVRSMRSGHHHLVISRKLVDEIIRVCDLSSNEKNLLETHVRPKFTTAASELRSCDVYVFCTPASNYDEPVPENAISIRLRSLEDHSFLSPSKLIVEDVLRDGEGLKMMLDIFQRHFMRGASWKFEFVHGGGSMTAATFKAAYVEPRPVLCVVDSDRRSPNGELGSTAKAVSAAQKSAPYPTAVSIILPVREIENAIPLRMIRLTYEQNGSAAIANVCQKLIEFCELENVSVNQRSKAIAFFDFKEGIKETDLELALMEYPDVLLDLWSHMNSNSPISNPIDPLSFMSNNPFSGISGNMLEAVSACYSVKPHIFRDISRNIKKHPNYLELEMMIKYIINFGAAPRPLPIRL